MTDNDNRVSLRLQPELLARVERLAVATGRTVSDVIRECVSGLPDPDVVAAGWEDALEVAWIETCPGFEPADDPLEAQLSRVLNELSTVSEKLAALPADPPTAGDAEVRVRAEVAVANERNILQRAVAELDREQNRIQAAIVARDRAAGDRARELFTANTLPALCGDVDRILDLLVDAVNTLSDGLSVAGMPLTVEGINGSIHHLRRHLARRWMHAIGDRSPLARLMMQPANMGLGFDGKPPAVQPHLFDTLTNAKL